MVTSSTLLIVQDFMRGTFMSIVRVGLAETKKFAEGYEAIFGSKQSSNPKKAKTKAPAKKAPAKKKKKAKKS
jgi:hypothetical protein